MCVFAFRGPCFSCEPCRALAPCVPDELQKRNEVIRAVTKRAHIVEAREKEGRRELNSTQQQLHEMGKKQQHSSQQYQDLEVETQSHKVTHIKK